MNDKIKAIGIIIAILAAIIIPQVIAAQQENDYKVFVLYRFVYQTNEQNGSNATAALWVNYMPVYPSTTYTFSGKQLNTAIDMSQPTKINDQIATAVKQQGNESGYNVVRVFVPNYDMKVP